MNKDLSNVTVTNDGRILKDISEKKEITCPTCKGKGRIPDPKCFGKVVSYCGRNGETVPHVDCRTCNGEGWVVTNNV